MRSKQLERISIKTFLLKHYLDRLSDLKHDLVHQAAYNLGYIHLAKDQKNLLSWGGLKMCFFIPLALYKTEHKTSRS